MCTRICFEMRHMEVPGGALVGWGTAQGEQYWGGSLKLRIPPWFPCVRYVIDGQEYVRIMGEGDVKDAWMVGQEVTLLYDVGNPRISIIKGDKSLHFKVRIELMTALILLICCIGAILLLV